MFYCTKTKIAEKGQNFIFENQMNCSAYQSLTLKSCACDLSQKSKDGKQDWCIVKSVSLSMSISLLVIRTNGLGYWDDDIWKQVNILSFRPKWIIPLNK